MFIYRKHYLSLDGMRGVAAILVMITHQWMLLSDNVMFPHGYLAVDFFFMLSGFVLEYGYGEAVRLNLSVWRFMRIRFLRIYPLLFLGSMFGLIAALYQGADLGAKLGLSLLLNCLAVPSPDGLGFGVGSWPLNPPTWSLFYELIGSLIFSMWLTRLTTLSLTIIALLSLVGLVGFSFMFGLGSVNHGFRIIHLPFASVRFLFSFTIGMVIYRIRDSFSFGNSIVAYGMLVLAIVGYQGGGLAYDLCCICIVFPSAIICAITNAPLAPLTASIQSWLGKVSYPLYMLHWPLMTTLSVARSKGLHMFSTRTIYPALVTLSTIGIAWLVGEIYDAPIRRLLSRSKRRGVTMGAVRKQ